MIREFTEYRIFCDGCGAECTGGSPEFTFDNYEQAQEFDPADISDWIEKDGKHFCQRCRVNLKEEAK